MLRTIAAQWAADGHEVEVFSSQPSYKQNHALRPAASTETLDGVFVNRVNLPSEHNRPLIRLTNIFRFAFAVKRHIERNGPYDLVMVSTAPPVFLAWAAMRAASKTGAQLVYHCMDIHPEIGRISGEFRNPLVFNLLQKLDIATCSYASVVVVLSDDMRQELKGRSGCADKVTARVINNFNLPTFGDAVTASGLPAEMEKGKGKFRILFAGNIGRFQGLESVIDAMHELKAFAHIELVFLGEGRALEGLKERAGDLLAGSVRFFPHQPLELARQMIATADLALVTLAEDIYRYAFPSKTMTYLAQGCPLLVSVEEESSLAKFVRGKDVGVVVTPGDSAGMARIIAELASSTADLKRMAINAARQADSEFSPAALMPKWSALAKEIGNSGGRP